MRLNHKNSFVNNWCGFIIFSEFKFLEKKLKVIHKFLRNRCRSPAWPSETARGFEIRRCKFDSGSRPTRIVARSIGDWKLEELKINSQSPSSLRSNLSLII